MTKFWNKLDEILAVSEIIIDRPKGSKHPKYPEFIYPLDYGYLKGTRSADDAEIDIWHGTRGDDIADAILCTIDVKKKDSEIKILIGCSDVDKKLILNFQNSSEYMAAILVERDKR